MIYILTGEDSFRLRKRLRELKEKFIKQGFSFFSFDFTKEDISSFQEEISRGTLFKKKRLFVLENFPFGKKFPSLSKGNDALIIIEKDIKKIPKSLLKEAHLEKFPLLEKNALKKWIKGKFSEEGIDISSPELNLVLEAAGEDLWSLSKEIEKLAAFKNFHGKIEKKDIEKFFDFIPEENVFFLIDTILSRNKKYALRLLANYSFSQKFSYSFFPMLAQYISFLLQVKEAGEKFLGYNLLFQKINAHPFVIKKSYSFARHYRLPEIKKLYRLVFSLDQKIKKGEILPQLSLLLLVLES